MAERIRSGRTGRPVGTITRGTTNPNRLRRVDRWMAGPQSWRLRRAEIPLVVDLGYGASPTTAVELHERLSRVRHDIRIVGVEIDAERVEVAKPLEHSGLAFRQGGFEIPTSASPVLVRAFNVLRQYDESEVAEHWALVQSRLAPGGLFVDGTCDEIGRRSSWVGLDRAGPQSLTISLRFGTFELPSDVAERLPKALIHRNVPGERIHEYLKALDRAWLEAAPLASFGNRQRWIAMCSAVQDAGWPLLDNRSRWRLGEVTVEWSAVAPAG